jgi:peptidylprolyl isomerase/peptidyl-prolyl cis-trans isomerase B (cyclophilin B)
MLLFTLAGCGASQPGVQTVATDPAPGQPPNPRVLLDTSRGRITLELFPRNAPLSVGNFLAYVKSGFYDGTVFHRVIPDFMIQGGGMTLDLAEKPTRAPIKNEADNGLRNLRGTLAMARTNDPQSATAQFFINVADSGFLDHRSNTESGWGYAVFGKVVAGMDVVDAISAVPRGSIGALDDVPDDPILIRHASVMPAN